MDSAALGKKLKPDFDRDGYLLIHGFFSPDEVRDLNQRFERLIAEKVPAMPATEAFYEVKDQPRTLKYISHLGEHDAWFSDLQRSDRFAKLAETLLADGVTTQGVEWFNKCSRIGKETPPHQDGYYYMLDPNEGTHFWLALDRVDRENGCIYYVKGSHKRGLRDHVRSQVLGFSQRIPDYGPADEALEEAMIMEPGDLLVHQTLTIHRAGANTSPRERRAMGLVYYPKRAKIDYARREKYQKKLMAELTEQGKI